MTALTRWLIKLFINTIALIYSLLFSLSSRQEEHLEIFLHCRKFSINFKSNDVNGTTINTAVDTISFGTIININRIIILMIMIVKLFCSHHSRSGTNSNTQFYGI